MFVCWSAKGGSGTTVVAAALALVLSRQRPTLLVDACGDSPAALGIAEPAGPGVTEWLASPTADPDALRRLSVPAADGLHVLPRGQSEPGTSRWPDLMAALEAGDRPVVVDAGTQVPPTLVPPTWQSVLVVRPCYLALRRVVACGARPDAVVLCTEPGRALTAADVAHTVGAPVVAVVPYDPNVARAVDAGLLAGRVPPSLLHPLLRAA